MSNQSLNAFFFERVASELIRALSASTRMTEALAVADRRLEIGGWNAQRVLETNFDVEPQPQPDNQVEILELEVADAAQPSDPDADGPEG